MKNIDNVYLEASKRLNLPVEVVRKAYSYYYKKGFYDKVLNGEGVSFYMAKFGTFRYSYAKVNQRIITLVKRIRKWRISTQYTPEKRIQIIEDYMNQLRMCFKIRKQLQEESKIYFNGNISRLLKSASKRNGALERYRTKPKNRTEEQTGELV